MSDVSRRDALPEHIELVQSLVAAIVDRGLPARGRTVGGVAGESGSGKSVTAVNLARALGDAGHPALVLHQDDYFRLPPRTNHAEREANISRVGPDEVNLALLQSHVAAFRDGRASVDAPRTNYAADRFDVEHVDFNAAHVLVIEGTYVLGLDALDLRIFLEATYADTRDRRRTRARDVDSPFVERVLAVEHGIIARQAAMADLLVSADFLVRAPMRMETRAH